jgi:hypothetical protein
VAEVHFRQVCFHQRLQNLNRFGALESKQTSVVVNRHFAVSREGAELLAKVREVLVPTASVEDHVDFRRGDLGDDRVINDAAAIVCDETQ